MKTLKGMCLRLSQFMVLILITAAASAQLHAGFTASQVSGCPNLIVSFSDTSTGNPTSWKWDLGNGTVSFLKNPIATYFDSGTYNVKLVVTNANGKDSVAKSKYIVVNALPVSYFRASDTSGCFPLKVQFKDSSLAGSGNIAKWQWDFGDGTLSGAQHPTHVYTSPGTFTVILKVTNSNGCTDVRTRTGYITISDGVKAGFSFVTVPGCSSPAPVNFINESVGTGVIDYLWDFGNGKTSNAINPTNNYASGIYTVKLIATNSFGCTDTLVKPNAVNVGFIHAGFTSDDSVCLGNNLAFTNTSAPSNFTSVTWDFGDGGSTSQTNPGRVYATPGRYKVKLVTTFGTCKDSTEKTVTVLPVPTAAFTASNTSACSGPLNVPFQDASTNAVSYNWNFGDGSTSTLKNPVHSYTNPGSYSVSLTVKNSVGCSSTFTKDGLVNFIPIKIKAINNLGIKDCLPVTVSPTSVLEGANSSISYAWDFGDGFVSTSSAPTHTYTKPGIYDVRLIINAPGGCTDTLIYKEAVKAGSKPLTKFSADPRDVCAVMPVNFTDLSTGAKVDEWLWYFGDGGSSSLQNPIYTYNDTGYFKVTLITYNLGCSDTLIVDKYIHVRPPIAKFDTAYTCNEPLKRNFIDKSIGAETWDWDFGDGATSKAQNPSHTYAAPGTYIVALTVSNGQCQHTSKKEVVVVKEHGALDISNLVSCINTKITFNVKNIKQSNIAGFSWYFEGANQNSVDASNPVDWTYSVPGVRYTSVIVKDILNCNDTLYATVPITSYGAKADFVSAVPNTCFGNTINFTDASKTDGIHSITQYLWDYGESTPQNYTTGPFSHDYSTTGNFNVKLVVTDSYGCKDSITKPSYVSITQPVAKFSASDTALCPSTPITFTNTSAGVNANYSWNFGDGTTSTNVSPSHSFSQPGSYKVTLAMVDVNGCTSADSTIINVYTAKADFAMSDSFKTCPDLTVNITNKSLNFISLNWDFGDGGNSQLTDPSHIYTYPGNYTVKLTVTNNGGCVDELTKKVVIQGPTGSFDYFPKEACNPGKVDYRITSQNNIVRYIWDFNDGNTIFSNSPSVSHTYGNSGVYLPKIILEDAGGCQVAVKGLDTIKVYSVNTNILSDTKMVCDSGIVVFRDSSVSNNPITGFLWNFGDGTSSTQRNPTHNFSDTGFYTVKLTTTTAFGCVDSTVSPKYIKVVKSPSVKISGQLAACEPAMIQLQGSLNRPDTSTITWAWDFGNGSVSNKQLPDSQTYINSGSYNITLKATNSDGCNNVASATAVINPKPVVDAGPDVQICRYNTTTLSATGASSYTWSTHPSLSCTNCATPVVKPDSLVTYYVTGKTLFGCTAQDSVTVRVQQPLKVVVGKTDTVCKGAVVTLNASGTDKYQWTPSLWLDNPTSSSPKARPDTTVTYQVVGMDNNGCFKDTQSVRIKVYPLPTVDITNGDNITIQVGSNVKLTTTSSADVISWKWSPAQWLSCGSCAEPTAAPKDRTTYFVTATNVGNCTATDKITVNVICNDANVYIPNTFSPNGDGANDVFYPRGTGLFTISSFKVFNRWGQVVFSKKGASPNNPLDGWDGNLNGLPLQPDVYVYLIEVVCSSNTILPFKGNVSLIR